VRAQQLRAADAASIQPPHRPRQRLEDRRSPPDLRPDSTPARACQSLPRPGRRHLGPPGRARAGTAQAPAGQSGSDAEPGSGNPQQVTRKSGNDTRTVRVTYRLSRVWGQFCGDYSRSCRLPDGDSVRGGDSWTLNAEFRDIRLTGARSASAALPNELALAPRPDAAIAFGGACHGHGSVCLSV
jgi:hypothetical protein